MNRQSLLIIAIIAGGSILGTVYATGTVINDSGITTPACTGCLTNAVSYSSYVTSLNTTIAGTSTGTNVGLLIGTDGSVITVDTSGESAIVKLDGTVVTVKPITTVFDSAQVHSTQSIDGKYKVILSAASSAIFVYKNNILLQTIGINISQFDGSNFSKASVSISPDGKYIAVSGGDTGGALQRVVIFGGS